MISQYWVGQIPSKPLSIRVKDGEGIDSDLSTYTNVKVKMLGTHNEELDLTGSVVNTNNSLTGRIIFIWPTDKSLFEYPGDYILQLELSGTNKKDFTSTHTIRVRELGRGYR
jgi:hypothetical protein